MILVPEVYLKSLQAQVISEPLINQVTSMETEMNKILQDESQPDDVKAKIYGELLRKFDVYRKQMKPEKNFKTEEEIGEVRKLDVKKLDVNTILKTVPKGKREKAEHVLKKLKEHPRVIDWNKEGEIIFNGKTIPGSSISALVNRSVNKRKGPREIGQKEFDTIISWKSFK